jgi:hypothetical protein
MSLAQPLALDEVGEDDADAGAVEIPGVAATAAVGDAGRSPCNLLNTSGKKICDTSAGSNFGGATRLAGDFPRS